jgi:hypothetical protein
LNSCQFSAFEILTIFRTLILNLHWIFQEGCFHQLITFIETDFKESAKIHFFTILIFKIDFFVLFYFDKNRSRCWGENCRSMMNRKSSKRSEGFDRWLDDSEIKISFCILHFTCISSINICYLLLKITLKKKIKEKVGQKKDPKSEMQNMKSIRVLFLLLALINYFIALFITLFLPKMTKQRQQQFLNRIKRPSNTNDCQNKIVFLAWILWSGGPWVDIT